MTVSDDWPIVGRGIVGVTVDISLENASVVTENSSVVLVLLVIRCLAKIAPRNADAFGPRLGTHS